MGTISRFFHGNLVEVQNLRPLGAIYGGVANASVRILTMVGCVLCQLLRGQRRVRPRGVGAFPL